MSKSTIVAAVLIFGALLAPATAQFESFPDRPMTKAGKCFNFSDGNNAAGRFRLLWIPHATPCRPPIQGYGLE
jgi:hypothetical protein